MELRIIETVAIVIIYFFSRITFRKYIDRTVEKSLMQKTRGKIIKKAVNFILLILSLFIILSVWGVNQSELVVFLGSVLAVIGIALFAQWSILSNITSGIIVFFNHPVKLDNEISIIDKDFQIDGRISDIGLFFVTIKTKEGEQITVPNNVFLQKMIKKKQS